MEVTKFKIPPLLAFLVLLLAGKIESGRILFFIGGVTSHSHQFSVQPLANKLAERGHDVTFHSPLPVPNPMFHPKIKRFCTEKLKQFTKTFQDDYGVAGLNSRVKQKFQNDLLSHPTAVFDWSLIMSEVLLRDPQFIDWVDGSKFDLIIMDSCMNELVYGLAHIFKAKTIVYGSLGTVLMWDVGTFGIPPELSWVPAYDAIYEGEMGFWDQLYNAYLTYRWAHKAKTFHYPNLDRLLRETLGHRVDGMPQLEQLIQNTSLMFINQHYSDQFARPYPPFVVQVGGMHIQEPNSTLPKDMESFIRADGDPGFIYISFGSIVKISTMPDWLLQVFLDTISKSKLRFLWKWEGELPKNVPKNVFFHRWFPQENVLAHPKVLGFIMQGGQVSIQQANCNGVPLIMFPVNGDQDFSAKRMRVIGHGIELEFFGLTSTELGKAIDDIVNIPRYREKAQSLSRACRNRPQSPLNTAVWWVEHAIKSDDLYLLKPLSMNQPIWMYWCLHIWAFVYTLLLLTSVVVLITIKYFLRLVSMFFTRKVQDGGQSSKKSR